jgi:hypothetical protein
VHGAGRTTCRAGNRHCWGGYPQVGTNFRPHDGRGGGGARFTQRRQRVGRKDEILARRQRPSGSLHHVDIGACASNAQRVFADRGAANHLRVVLSRARGAIKKTPIAPSSVLRVENEGSRRVRRAAERRSHGARRWGARTSAGSGDPQRGGGNARRTPASARMADLGISVGHLSLSWMVLRVAVHGLTWAREGRAGESTFRVSRAAAVCAGLTRGRVDGASRRGGDAALARETSSRGRLRRGEEQSAA